ncbi:ion channel [Luteimonas pelagia]
MDTPDERRGALVRGYAWLQRHPSAILLAVQLLGVLLYPLMVEFAVGRALFGAFGVLVVVLAVWVTSRNPGIKWVGWILAVPAIVLSLASPLWGQDGWQAAGYVFEAALYLYAAGTITAYMLGDSRITTDDLFAIGATFTLLAWAFAYAYAACQLLVPGSFLGTGDLESPRSWIELLFLSFSTLSSTGLSDIVPVQPMARALMMLEMFAGVMYIALVVARMVGLVAARGVSHAD